MFKKIIIAALAVTVVGSIGAAVAYQAVNSNEMAEAAEADIAPDAPPANDAAVQAEQTADAAVPNGEPQVMAEDMVGEPWDGAGVIVSLDDNGMTVVMEDGTETYVELGPPFAWQEMISMQAGDQVRVDGFFNGEQVHARIVTLANGESLELRTETGAPLWSGGSNGNGANGENGAASGVADGTHSPTPQVSVDEWITYVGTLDWVGNGQMTMTTTDGESISFQVGQPRFFESQGVTFTADDSVEVLGYWQGESFQAGQIMNTDTNELVMLRDPNGRPLWAGPGANGSGGTGNGNGGNGNGGGQ